MQIKKLLEKIELNKQRQNLEKLLKLFKKNSKKYLQTNILFSTFFISSIINVTLLRAFTIGNYFAIYPIIADAAILLIIGSFGYYIKAPHQFKYFFSLAVAITTLTIVNSMYYTNYLSFSSISLFATSSQIIDVADAVVQNVMRPKDFIFLWQIPLLIYVNFLLKKRDYYNKVFKIEKRVVRAVNTLIVGGILVGVFISTLNTVDISRFSKQWNREYIVLRFGILTYQVNDAYATLRSQISPFFGYDSSSKLFREYYENNLKTTKKNKYTNIFEGKNIILIHAESIQTFTLDAKFNGQYVAPTMRKLSKEGLYFSNFYSQEGVGTSSDTEFTLSTSLMPSSSGTVFVNYFNRDYITMEKLLKNKGYYIASMHGNNGSFWNRKVTHQYLGYDRMFAFPEDYILDETIGLGLSDMSFFDQSIEKIKDISKTNNKYMVKLITLTNHTPFTDIERISDFEVDYKYERINDETGEKEIVSAPYLEGTLMGSYMKSVNYSDFALGQFLDKLEQEGLLENTVVIIYGDHDARIRRSEYLRYYNYDPYTDSILNKDHEDYQTMDYYQYELNRKVPLIIWTKDKKLKQEVTTVMGMYDIKPTLGNMFGFHNPYALGNDIFNLKDNLVVFPSGNWLTNSIYYNTQKDEGFALKQEIISLEYIEEKNKQAEKILGVSNAIIVHDLQKGILNNN
jgi:lipoteichoic acid synthase